MTTPTPSPPGAIEIGVFIEAFGNGILISQMFSYFQKHGKDAKLFQFMIFLIWITSALTLIFCAWALGSSLTYNHKTTIPPHLPLVVGGIHGITMHNLIQVLRAYQLHKLGSGKSWLSVFSWILSAYSTAMGISYFVVLRSENLLGNFDLGTNLPNSPIWMIYSACSVVILNQLIISAGTYRRLVMGRDRGLKGATRNVTNFLAAISIRVVVGIIIVGICLIIVPAVIFHSTIEGTWVGVFLSVTTVHPILLMRLLNGRAKLRERYFANDVHVVSSSSLAFGHNPSPRVSSVLVISRETILPENNPVRRPSVDQDLP